MNLYFFRHGPAGSKSAWDGDDADRPLTEKGRALTESVAQRLAEAGIEVDLVITSPFVRAVQTAQIAAKTLGVLQPLVQDDLLRPGFDLTALDELLARNQAVGSVMLVGHESDFSTVIGQLVGSARLVLKKSGVALVELPEPKAANGTLLWLVPPSLLA